METLILYAFCTASMFYLGSRARVTSWLWSKYPNRLAQFMDCAACSGAWYGMIVGAVGGYWLGLSFLGLPGNQWTTALIVGLTSISFTPIVAGLVQRGFDAIGHAVLIEEIPDDAEGPK